jgi:peptide deformylase
MALRNLAYEGDEILRKRSKEVKEINERIQTLIDDMWETMYEHNGCGLAAPQVNVLRRIVVIDVTEPPEESEEGAEDAAGDFAEPEIVKYTLINPEITFRSEELQNDKEGCLSVPGVVGRVQRPARVTVKALDRDGEEIIVEGEGMLAKAICHEIDHLDGILFVDNATDIIDANEAED